MKLLQERHVWTLATGAAMAAVIGFASPAAAAEQSTTTVVTNPAAATVGQAVQLNATVSCPLDPSVGTLGVTFFDGTTELATAPVGTNGASSLITAFDTTGTHKITAAYNGNDNCGASNDDTTIVVSQATPPPPPPNQPCLFFCGGSLIGFNVGNINNNIIIG